MSKREKILDDIAQLAGGAVGALSDAGKQAGNIVRVNVDHLAQELDLVPREEFERLELMLAQAREEQDAMKKRIEALEQEIQKKK